MTPPITCTDWAIVEGLRRASVDGVGPTMPEWDRFVGAEAEGVLPRSLTVAKRFGGWSRALLVADLKPQATRWERYSIAQAMRHDFEKRGHWPTSLDWSSKAVPRGSRPSANAVYRHFASWGEAIEAVKGLACE